MVGFDTRKLVTYNPDHMGTFSVKFALKNPLRPDQQLELEGLVDTGALFTQIPANLVAQIGLVASGVRAVHYADGTKDVVPVADAKIAIHGVETSNMVLCGKPNSLVLLGATTLETLGLGVDPIHKRLIPIEAPMASSPIRSLPPSGLGWKGWARRFGCHFILQGRLG